MKVNKLRIWNIFLFILVLLPIYQDSPLSLVLGAAGYSLLTVLSLIFFCIYVCIYRKVPKNKYLGHIMKLGIWLIVISFFAIMVWKIIGNPLTVVGEFLPIKAIKVILQYLAYPAYIALMIICTRKTGTDAVAKYAYYTLIILTVICILELQQLPYAFENLHFAGTFPYYRIRLLTLESSTTATLIYVYFALALYYSVTNKKRVSGTVSIICALILLTTTTSKTLMIVVAITVVMYVFFAFKKLNKKTMTGLLIASITLIGFALFILPDLTLGLSNDMSKYTSVSTRLYTGILGLLIGVVVPCGVGGGVYLGVFQTALSQYLGFFEHLPFELNTSEIIRLATSTTDMALTVKSGVLHYNMYWGILGTIYLFRSFLKLSKRISESEHQHKELLLSFFWTAIIMISFFSLFSFEFCLLYVFLISLDEENNKKNALYKY